MNQQTIIGTILSLFLFPFVALAVPDVGVQPPKDSGKLPTYFHAESEVIVMTVCPKGTRLLNRESLCLVGDKEEKPIDVIRMPEQQFRNQLTLTMLSERVTFEDEELQRQLEFYREHGSLKNFELLEERQKLIGEELAAYEKFGGDIESKFGSGKDATWVKAYQQQTEILLAEREESEKAIKELNELISGMVAKVLEANPDNPTIWKVGDKNPESVVALAYLGKAEDKGSHIVPIPIVWKRVRVMPFKMGSPEGEAGRDNDETETPAPLTQDFQMMAMGMTNEHLKALGVPEDLFEERSHFKGSNLPREMVSWEEAMKVVEWLNKKDNKWHYQLPTEAQREYATRAGSKGAYHFVGDDYANDLEEDLKKHAWYGANSESAKYPDGSTHAVASKLPNGFGLFDMHGNVWEWCFNKYLDDSSYSSIIENPTREADEKEAGSARVMRGGGWNGSARSLRSAYRGRGGPGRRVSDVGFRLLRTPK